MTDTPPKDYRDPKVTTPTKDTKRSGGMNWLWIAIAALIILALLAWLLGWFGAENETVIVPTETTTETVIVPAEETTEEVIVPAN